MSHSFDEPDLAVDDEQTLSRLLGTLPPLLMPTDVRTRIQATLASQAATRTALISNDADLGQAPSPLEKRIPAVEPTPATADRERLGHYTKP